MAAKTNLSAFGYTRESRVPKIPGVLSISHGNVGKPKGGDPHAGWALPKVDAEKLVHAEIRPVPCDVASMAASIRAAEGLPDELARGIETGGAS